MIENIVNVKKVDAEKNLPVLTVCSYCKRVQEEGSDKWVAPSDPRYKSLMQQYEHRLSHGPCNPCLEIQRKQLRDYRKAREANGK